MNAKLVSIAALAGLLAGFTAIGHAQAAGDRQDPAASSASGGHEMWSEGNRSRRGASQGHRLDRDDVDGSGDRTTGFGGHDGDDRLHDDGDDRMMDNDRRGIDND